MCYLHYCTYIKYHIKKNKGRKGGKGLSWSEDIVKKVEIMKLSDPLDAKLKEREKSRNIQNVYLKE